MLPMSASFKSSLRHAKRVIISAAAVTTALGIGAGSAAALPSLKDLNPFGGNSENFTLPQLPALNSKDVLPELSNALDQSSVKLPDSVVALINENLQFAKDNGALVEQTRDQLLAVVDKLPLPEAQKAEAARIIKQAFAPLEELTKPTEEPQPAPAPAPETTPSRETRPAPENPCPPTARACVDLANNTTWLQENGTITYGPVPMSSGMPGYETTRGYLSVTRKVKDEWSVPYNGPMPYSVYFTNDGEAFHEGSVYQQSHGCIHLEHDAAVTYFDTLQVGDGVYIW